MPASVRAVDCAIHPDLPGINVWASTQPMEEPEAPRHLLDTLEWVGWDCVMYASDYPHWDFDDPLVAIPSFLGAERRRMIYADNARALYGGGPGAQGMR